MRSSAQRAAAGSGLDVAVTPIGRPHRPQVNFTTPFVLNSGVVLVRASERGAALLREWASLRHACTGRRFHRQPEQKCLERMLLGAADTGASAAARAVAATDTSGVAIAPMGLFNSPWARYVRHVWGGTGNELRATAFDDELRVQGVWTPAQLDALVRRARAAERVGCGS